MFRCNHCNREYGGIRGIATDDMVEFCARCTTESKKGSLPASARLGAAHLEPAVAIANPERGRILAA
jgi:hypothetical protein